MNYDFDTTIADHEIESCSLLGMSISQIAEMVGTTRDQLDEYINNTPHAEGLRAKSLNQYKKELAKAELDYIKSGKAGSQNVLMSRVGAGKEPPVLVEFKRGDMRSEDELERLDKLEITLRERQLKKWCTSQSD